MKKYTEKYWSDQLTRSRHTHRQFTQDAEMSINIYDRRTHLEDVQRQIGLWYYTIDTLLPVYCSRIPKVEVQLRKRTGSLVDQLASQGLERAVQFGLESYFPFFPTVQGLAKDFLLTGRAVSWVRYQPSLDTKSYEYSVTRDKASGMLVDPMGNMIDPSTVEIISENKKGAVIRDNVPSKDDEKFIIDRVHWQDYLVSPARCSSEIEWQSKRAFLTRDEVASMFGSKVADQIEFDVFPKDSDISREETPEYEGKSEWHEIWCKETGKVYWICERAKDRVIESGEPPLEFDDFFPCDVLTANESPRSIIPVSDWVQVKDMVLEIERLTTRMSGLIQSIRVTGAYDGTLAEDLNAMLSGDFKLIPIKRWASYKNQRGGMANMIEMLNIQPYVDALATSIQTRNELLTRYYEAVKIADIMRGAADAQETATAQRLKSGWASFGLKVRQNSFADFISRGISKTAKIVTDVFSESHIFQMVDGGDLMKQAQAGGAPIESFTVIVDAMRAGMNEYRIAAASDSFVEINDAEERVFRKELLEGTGMFLQQLQPMLEQYPQFLPYAMELMRYTNRSFKVGKDLEATLDGTLQTIGAAIKQQQEEAAQQPEQQPPEVLIAQAEVQVAQIKQQTEMARMQMDQQKMEAELMLKQQQALAEQEAKAAQLLLDFEKLKSANDEMQAQLALKQADLALRAQEMQLRMAAGAEDQATKTAIEAAYLMLEKEKTEIERTRVKMADAERMLEERRLQMQAATALMNAGVKANGNRGSVPVLQGAVQGSPEGSGY